jgi:hypothetical protein
MVYSMRSDATFGKFYLYGYTDKACRNTPGILKMALGCFLHQPLWHRYFVPKPSEDTI